MLYLFLFVVGSHGCDQGLSPEPPPQYEYGIAGVLRCANWPPADSVRRLAVAAFKERPSGNIISAVTEGIGNNTVAFRFLTFTYGDSVIAYELLLSPVPPGIFQYVAVGQYFGPPAGITNPAYWRVVGAYPTTLLVPVNQIVTGIDIIVDFRNPPPLP